MIRLSLWDVRFTTTLNQLCSKRTSNDMSG